MNINCEHCGRTVKAVPGDHSCKGGPEVCPNAHRQVQRTTDKIEQLQTTLKNIIDQQKIICGCGDHINHETDFHCCKCNKWYCATCAMEGNEAGSEWMCRDCSQNANQ